MTKNIKDIAPLLAYHYLDIDVDLARSEFMDKLVVTNAQRFVIYKNYLGLLHDSWVIKTNITEDKFSITLNDFTTHVFSDVIVDKKKLSIAHNKLVFPIQLEFETTNLTFNTVNEEGNIQPIAPTSIDEYLYEEVISIDKEIIEIGLIVWKNGNSRKPSQQILILMTVKNIRVTELQDEAWTEIFGNAYDNYYQYFKAQLETGRYLSDQPSCYELYAEYEASQV
jgi:hypothetical protein